MHHFAAMTLVLHLWSMTCTVMTSQIGVGETLQTYRVVSSRPVIFTVQASILREPTYISLHLGLVS